MRTLAVGPSAKRGGQVIQADSAEYVRGRNNASSASGEGVRNIFSAATYPRLKVLCIKKGGAVEAGRQNLSIESSVALVAEVRG